jgi:cytochrome b
MPRIRVWDLPLRIFHWALAFCVIAAYISQSIGGNAMVWHGRFGLAVLGLVSFPSGVGFCWLDQPRASAISCVARRPSQPICAANGRAPGITPWVRFPL